MNLQAEIMKLAEKYANHVERQVRKRARGIVLASPARTAAKRSTKPTGARGVRHCRICTKKGHDARNCEKAA